MHKVLVTFGGYGAGTYAGATRMAWRTSHQLARSGYDIAVITDADRPGALATGIGDRPLGAPEPGWHPDVVHAYDLARPAFVEVGREWARRCGVPLVLTPASAATVWPDPELGRRCLGEADVVFVMNAKEEAETRAVARPSADILYIPQAPDLTGTPDPERFRGRYGITGPMVLFLGRRVPSKGHSVLLDAAPLVWGTLSDATFVFAGPGGDDDISSRHDRRLIDVGPLEELAKHDALAAADVLCLPTGADLFPLVFAEAWSCGRPVVSADFPGVADVVRDGVDGLVARRTPRDLAAALLRLLGDEELRRRLGAAGRRRVADAMSWERVATVVAKGYHAASGAWASGAHS
ncbi:glycosyltransferase family 4 protein [Streptomyces sp. NPDC020731]|uniref:glycosyltransferase family 4 protein n=1 Tax=Streptomyces sp. NPDC020731 TaxID=3365085 RepID=UPI003794D212